MPSTVQTKRRLEAAVKAATAMGASNPLTTVDDQQWEEDAGVLQVKSGYGAAGVKVGGTSTAFVESGESGFENLGANISWNGSGLENDNVDGTDYALGETATSNVTYSSFVPSNTVDGNSSTYWHSTGPGYIQVQMATQRAITSVYIDGNCPGGSYVATIQGSNDGVGFTTVYTGAPGNMTTVRGDNRFDFANVTAYYYYKINIASGSGNDKIYTMSFFIPTKASTGNTADTIEMVDAGMYSFQPSSLVVKDDGGTNIAGDTFNIAYNVDGAGFSSLVPQSTFKALSPTLFADASSLVLRVQPIDSETISSVQISTLSTGIVQSKGGSVTNTVGGVEVFSIGSDGAVVAGTLKLTNNIDGTDDDAVTVGPGENIVRCDTGGSAVTVNLPDLANANTFDGQRVRISDDDDNAAANNITIVPANTIEDLDVDVLSDQGGNTERATFNGSPDLSNVKVGNFAVVSNATNGANNGTFEITAVGATYIEWTNASLVAESSDSPATITIEQRIEQDVGAVATNRHTIDSNGEVVILIAHKTKMRWEVE